jgi:hypothetical protein
LNVPQKLLVQIYSIIKTYLYKKQNIMLTVSIPDELDKQLSSVTTDKKEFIIAAIIQKITFLKRSITPEDLAKEYADTVRENDEITKDFAHVDNENWNDY